jgi:phage anti-repressor protein
MARSEPIRISAASLKDMAMTALATTILSKPAVLAIDIEKRQAVGATLMKALEDDSGFPVSLDDAAEFLQFSTRTSVVRKLVDLSFEEGRDFIKRPGTHSPEPEPTLDGTPFANIRVDFDTKYGSVVDVIVAVSTHSPQNASVTFTRLKSSAPELYTKCIQLRIDGKGRETPVADPATLIEIAWLVGEGRSSELRRKGADLVQRFMGADLSFIDEIEKRHDTQAGTEQQRFLIGGAADSTLDVQSDYFLSIGGFEHLCMAAGGERGKLIRNYLLAIKNEYNGVLAATNREQAILTAYDGKGVLYVGVIQAEKPKMCKFGYTDDIKDRYREHKRTYVAPYSFDLTWVIEADNPRKAEGMFKAIDDIKANMTPIRIGTKTKTEIFTMSDGFSNEKLCHYMRRAAALAASDDLLIMCPVDREVLLEREITRRLEIEMDTVRLQLDHEYRMARLKRKSCEPLEPETTVEPPDSETDAADNEVDGLLPVLRHQNEPMIQNVSAEEICAPVEGQDMKTDISQFDEVEADEIVIPLPRS